MGVGGGVAEFREMERGKKEDRLVTAFMSSQPQWLYQGEEKKKKKKDDDEEEEEEEEEKAEREEKNKREKLKQTEKQQKDGGRETDGQRQTEGEWENEGMNKLHFMRVGVDTGSFYMQPSSMRDLLYWY